MGIGKSIIKGIGELTPVGKRISAGLKDAKVSLNKECIVLPGKNNNIFKNLKNNIFSGGMGKALHFLHDDNELKGLLLIYANKTIPKFKNVKITTEVDAYQTIIEKAGVGPTKIAQIMSDNPDILKKIKNTNLIKALKNTKTNCSFNQTVKQAQTRMDKGFSGEYHIIKEKKAASIGAVYDVKRPGMDDGVAKMIKNGVDNTQLAIEEGLLKRIINEYGGGAKEKEEALKMVENLYNGFREEVDFFSELENNKLLSQGAKRYKVAKITDISKDGKIIIMDKAQGIQMNRLLEILKDYKANPENFAKKYASEIKENPWLGKPDKVINELQKTILGAFDEQFLFVKKGGYSIMHGDPHTGNYFITVDKNGKLIPEFIDTGSIVKRTSQQIGNDLKFFSNFFVGNSKEVAKYFVEQCAYSGADKEKIVEKVAKDIQDTIFGQKQNTTNYSTILKNINIILEKNGLKLKIDNATAMKAQLQFLSVAKEAAMLSEQNLDFMTVLKDVPKASLSLLGNGENPLSVLKDAIKFAFYNQQQAIKTFGQFLLQGKELKVKSAAA